MADTFAVLVDADGVVVAVVVLADTFAVLVDADGVVVAVVVLMDDDGFVASSNLLCEGISI